MDYRFWCITSYGSERGSFLFFELKSVEFTSDSVSIIDMHNNSIIAIGEVDHKSRLYKFTKFSNDVYSILLTHKETNLHAPPVQHAYTLILPLVSDIRDNSMHSDSIHGNKQVV
jgi:hypothetical protein